MDALGCLPVDRQSSGRFFFFKKTATCLLVDWQSSGKKTAT